MKAVIKNNLKLPDAKGFDFKEDLKLIADKIVIKTIQVNLDEEKDLQEKKFSPITDETKKTKREQGLSPLTLTATGLMRISMKRRDKGRNTLVIYFDKERADVAKKLQIDGVESKQYGKRKWNFFGINTRMEKEAIKLMERKIKELVDRARRGKS